MAKQFKAINDRTGEEKAFTLTSFRDEGQPQGFRVLNPAAYDAAFLEARASGDLPENTITPESVVRQSREDANQIARETFPEAQPDPIDAPQDRRGTRPQAPRGATGPQGATGATGSATGPTGRSS